MEDGETNHLEISRLAFLESQATAHNGSSGR